MKIKFNAPVVLTFSALCLAAFIADILTGGKSNTLLFITWHTPLNQPMTWVRFFTHVLGHSSWSHLVGNMSYILLLGPLLEEKYGKDNIFTIIIVVALSTGLINYFLFPTTGLLGASGVCFAFILLSSFTSIQEKEIPITFILIVIIYLGQQIYEGIFVENNISNMAHIVGGLIGGASGFLMARRGGKTSEDKPSVNPN